MAIRGRDLQDVVNIVSVLDVVLTKEKVCNTETSRGVTLPSTSAIKCAHKAIQINWKAC